MGHHTAIIFPGGDPPHVIAAAAVEEALRSPGHGGDTGDGGVLVIAADSGWGHALAHGIVPGVLVGDMDSIDPDDLAAARAISHERGTPEILEHPRDKDLTDTEIALAVAAGRGCGRIIVVSGGGDRPDHVLAMLHSVCSPVLAHARVEGWIAGSRFVVCAQGRTTPLGNDPGDTVSLHAVAGDASVSTGGLAWSLEKSTLVSTGSRGVSNIATAAAGITVHEGTVLAFITKAGHP